MKIHELKILEDFANAIIDGDKTFEIRENDRGYQKGDRVRFKVVGKCESTYEHLIEKNTYEITYVINGWGLKNGYVVFGIREVEE